MRYSTINSHLRNIRLFLIICTFACTFAAESRGENVSRRSALERLTAPQLKLHVERLADDTFEGREAGSRGGRAAAGYIVERLRSLPLTPAGDEGTMFQPFGEGYRNILVLAEGSDPQLKNEIVVLGAHFDHVGYGSRRNSYGPWGYIHNGADDNASGSSALLEIASAWATLEPRPARSLLIAFWDAEEKGLLGSKHWCSQPTVDWARVKCCVNIDMIGRLTRDRVIVYGTRTGPGLRRQVSESNSDGGPGIDFDWTMKDDSDHFPFFQKQVPVLMFHTGLHRDYHRPSDDSERINLEGTVRVTKLIASTLLQLADAPQLPDFRAAAKGEDENARHTFESSGTASAPRFGAAWRAREGTAGQELVVTQVHFNSVAQRAGFRVDDVVTHLNGKSIDDEFRFRRHLLTTNELVNLRFQRGGHTFNVSLTLHGQPVRVGFSWRTDDAEPDSMLVTNVVYGSPAHDAGLLARDRIYSVAGKDIASDGELRSLLETSQGDVSLRYERSGRIHETLLKLSQ